MQCSTQTIVGELTEVGQRLIVAVGGLGGKGNAALRTKGTCCNVTVLYLRRGPELNDINSICMKMLRVHATICC